MKTDEVRIHHRGGGVPGLTWVDGHYCMIVGPKRYFLQFGPEQDTSTKGENGKVLGVCFDGNREQHPVLESEIQALRDGMDMARRRGYVTDHPRVLPHSSPLLRVLGNATVCPGSKVVNPGVWAMVVGACHAPIFDVEAWIRDLGYVRPGNRNKRVAYLQALLNLVVGSRLAGKGYFGIRTVRAVVKFKKFCGLRGGPGVGPKTWRALIFFAGLKAGG
jgi:hypothetical protein